MVSEALRSISSNGVESVLHNPEQYGQTSHTVISTGPSKHNRSIPERWIASQYVLDVMCRQALNHQLMEIKRIYYTLRDDSQMATAAGMFFEYRVHRLLCEGRTINIYPVLCKSKKRRKPKGEEFFVYNDYSARNTGEPEQLILSEFDTKIVSKGEVKNIRKNTYYRPTEKNFPSVDSWLLLEPTPRHPVLLKFQITLNKTEHVILKTGLDIVDKLAPLAKERYLVVVTEEGLCPKIPVPASCLGGGSRPDGYFKVYHLTFSRDELFPPLVI